MHIIKERIESLQLPDSAYAPLNEQQLAKIISALRSEMTGGKATQAFSIADMSSETISAKLGSLEVREQTVWAYWPAFREGFEIIWEVFVSRFDELWYPSSDDLIVMPPAATWVLEVSHE